jgi:hypothetical protein
MEDISQSSVVLGQYYACGANNRDQCVWKGIWGLGPFRQGRRAAKNRPEGFFLIFSCISKGAAQKF